MVRSGIGERERDVNCLFLVLETRVMKEGRKLIIIIKLMDERM